MSKAILKRYIQEQTGITPQEAGIVLDVVIDGITETLLKNGKVTIPNFGRYNIKTSQERIARNPKTGELVKVPARKVVRFRVARKLKSAVMKNTN